MNRSQFNQYIKDAEFGTLFNELGWDNIPRNQYNTTVVITDTDYEMCAICRKSGFIVYRCEVDVIPQPAFCRKIDMQLMKSSHDYIVIFHKRDSEHHLWIAPIKTVEKRDIVKIEYAESARAEFLFSKLDSISFGIDEVVTIVDVTKRIHEAFAVNSGKITKDFYAGFKTQHKAFVKFIQGINVEGDKQWYASVMLNRLMFCYFIQKKGFLNFDKDYLRNKLEWAKGQQSEDTFFKSFYKGFLCALFHGGLNSPTHNPEFEKIYGRIPYLNGGMFDVHQLEKDYADIDIADEAFEDLFTFFDRWRWHLDTRITATGKDINPDVLGYIFEQYINDRAQMGAYYTKEDITEYIGKNCIIPFLMDRVAETTSSKDFKSSGFVWTTLKNSSDKYIYDAVKRGVTESLPDYIEQGIDTTQPNLLERRARWNEKSTENLALPTEIWRETVERRKRYADIKAKIEGGEIISINDFITYNLDIRQFTFDLLATTQDHLFVKHFYKALQEVTILDPTCGSGAFLFAALNILEPLYEVCIHRMEEFNQANNKLFVDELSEIANKYRSNIQHFVYKSIILRNLYGVDIMVEATEIAKLRLFLKMVAVVDVDKRADNLGLDPLPDIDFNIRCGNTLVGYATKAELNRDLVGGDMFAVAELRDKIELEMQKVSMAYDLFKVIQLNQQDDIVSFKKAKSELQSRLTSLNSTINHLMYGTRTGITYEDWLSSHQPFHWLAEFYQIIEGNGGFDVIIGNPPYVVYTKKDKKTKKSVADIYKLDGLVTMKSNNLYAFCIERSLTLLNSSKRIGMIVPLSLVSASNMVSLRRILEQNGNTYVSSYEIRPSKLFDGVDQRLNIFLSYGSKNSKMYTTGVLRWNSECRVFLFNDIYYTESINGERLVRLSNNCERSLLDKFSANNPMSLYTQQANNNLMHYRSAGLRYWIIFLQNGFGTESTSNKAIKLDRSELVGYYMAALNSSLFWWYYATNYDMFNLTAQNIVDFRLTYNSDLELATLSNKLESDLNANKQLLITNKQDGDTNTSYAFQKKVSKPIIDEIDKVLAKHYGFTEEELDFIINYDIKYRMGSELDNE